MQVNLAYVGWDNTYEVTIQVTEMAFINMIALAHPSENRQVCLYTDASTGFLGSRVYPYRFQPVRKQTGRPRSQALGGKLLGASASFFGPCHEEVA